jgi:hypothetical protein
MGRSTVPGPIQAAASDHLALDPDMTGTGLSAEQREKLWAMAPASTEASFGAFAADALTGPTPYLPTGDGTAGGDLHVVLAPPTEVTQPLRLLAVWPPGAAEWVPGVEGRDYEDLKRFLEVPHIEVTVSRALADDALGSPRDWVRLWQMVRDGDYLYSLTELGLVARDLTDLADGSVRYQLTIEPPDDWPNRGIYLVQVRSTPPISGTSPVGRDDPQVLLDADVAATALGSQTLFQIWSGDPQAEPVPWLKPLPTESVQLFDGTEGGLAHWAFTIGRA